MVEGKGLIAAMTSPGRGQAADDVRDDAFTRRVIGCAIAVRRTLGVLRVEKSSKLFPENSPLHR